MNDRTDKPGQGNKPVDVLWDRSLKVAIFRNEGERGPFYTMVPSRVFKDEKTGEMRETSSFTGGDGLRMSNLLAESYKRTVQFHQEAKADRQPDNPDHARERGRERRR